MSTRQKTVWIVNHYATNAQRDGRSGRHDQLASHLAQHGWHSVVVAASTDHPSGRQTLRRFRLRERWSGPHHEFLWLRGVGYDGNGALRVLDILSFTVLLLLPGSTRRLPRPDVVIGGSVHPLAAWAAGVVARRLGVPFIYEPRDLWPESLIQYGAIAAQSVVARLLRHIERRTVSMAGLVVSPLRGAGRYYAERGLPRPFLWVSNGVTPAPAHDVVDTGTSDGARRDDDRFEIAYLGSMGQANALGPVLEAFEAAAGRPGGERLVLRMVGTGPARAELQRRAAGGRHADRVVFDGHVPQSRAREIGRAADCLVVNLHPIDLYRHGTSLNKFFEYLMLGKPIVVGTSVDDDVVTDAGAGIKVAGSDVEGLAAAMLTMAATPAARLAEMGGRGRAHVLRHYRYAVLAERLGEGLDAVRLGRASELGRVETPELQS